ncbi:hypothetical protein NWF32_25750 [Pseudomonas qingdaonensis]|nr:hypothetical protein [Pseudomonas qingdaonensis]
MTPHGTSPSGAPALRKAIIAAAIGNFITWFEYASYGFLAVILGRVFFPVSTPPPACWPPSPRSASRF